MVKTGAGEVILASADSYTGGTTVAAGILRLQNSNALGSNAASTSVAGGASLELDGTTAGGPLAIGAQALTLNGPGISTVVGTGLTTIIGSTSTPGTVVSSSGALHSTGGNNSYAGAITLGSASQINSEVTGNTLTLTGGITGGGFPLTIAGSGNTAITTTGISGISSLIKNDDGTLRLAAANTYAGVTSINAGTVAVQIGGGLGSGGVVVAFGASLNLQNNITVNNSLTISGNGAGTAGQNGAISSSGNNNLGGVITLAANATISSDSGTLSLNNGNYINASGFTLTLAGAGTGVTVDGLTAGSLIKNGSGTWTMQASSNYSGSTTVNAGTLTLAAGAFSSTAVIVNGGTLNTAVNGFFVATPSLTLGGGAFVYNGLGVANSFTEAMGSLTLTPGTVSGITVNNQNDAATTLRLGSSFTRGADSILNINLTPGQGTGAAVAATSPTGSGAPTGTNNIFGYILVTDSGGTGLGMLNGSNQIVRFNSSTLATTLTSTSNSATTDFTTLNTTYTGGVLDWSNGNTLGARSVNSLTIDTTTRGGSILLGGDPGATLPAVLSISSGALVFQGGNNETIYGGQIGATNSELDIHQLGSGALTIASAIGSGSTSVVKDGSGTVVITGPGSQIGVLTNNSNTITGLASTTGLYVGEQVTGSGIAAGSYVTSITNGTSIVISSPVSEFAATTTFAASSTPTATTTLTFGAQDTYSGNTYVDAGTIKGGSTNAFSANSGFVFANTAGALLDLNGFDQVVGSIAGGGSTGGNIALTNGATLTVGAGTNGVGGTINPITNLGSAFNWNSYGGLISGSGSLALAGGSTLYLTNNNNSYTGFTNILSGTVVINNIHALGNSSTTITVAGISGAMNPNGMLVLQGGSQGLVINRNIDISGAGTGQSNGNLDYALLSIGNNTFNGILTSASNSDTRIANVGGTSVFSKSSVINLGPNGGNAACERHGQRPDHHRSR